MVFHDYSKNVGKYFLILRNQIKVQKKTLFAGDSEIDQLYRIFRTLGTPNEKMWPGVSQLSDFTPNFPDWPPRKLCEVLNKLDQPSIAIIQVRLEINVFFLIFYSLKVL